MHRQCVRLMAIASLLIATPARATTFDWSNASGGIFGTAANWTPVGGPPNSNDTARFSLPNTYSVALNSSTNVGALSQTQGDVTFNLNSNFYSALSTTSNSLGAAGLASTMHFTGGVIILGGMNVGNVAGSTSNLYLDTATATTVGFGNFYVGSVGAGNLWLQNGATLSTQISTAIGAGSGSVGAATVTGANSAWTMSNVPLRVGSSGTGTLNVLAGGSVTAYALEVGENLASNGTISMSGLGATLTVPSGAGVGQGIANIGGTLSSSPAASATLNLGAGAVMSLNGTTNFRTNAKVNMTGGRLDLNMVNFDTGASVNWSSGQINFATGPTITPSILDILLASTHTLGTGRTLSATAGTLTLTTPLTITGGAVSAPTIDLGANLDIDAFSNISATNTITLQPSATIQLGNFATLAATTSVTNNGGTLILQGPLANVTGPMANNTGIITGTGRFTAGLNNGAGGTVRVETGDHIVVDTVGSTNAGTIELAGGTVEYTQSLTNQATGTISGRGAFRGSTAAPGDLGLTNQGVLSFSAGVTDIYGDVNNAAGGKIIVAGGSTVTFYDDVVHNGVEIRTNNGSRSVFFGSVTGAGPFTGTGDVELNGDLKPGNSPATVTFGGNVEINSTGGLQIELAGTAKGTQYDSLTIAGTATLGGSLDVSLLNGFAPQAGNAFDILDWGSHTGKFNSIELPALASGLQWDTSQLDSTGVLSVIALGDFNNDHAVNAADYATWRKHDSTSSQYIAWRENFSQTNSAADPISSSAAVPEPNAIVILFASLFFITAVIRPMR
jgi:T5SS/PEP-CTERM-associated repeat protein